MFSSMLAPLSSLLLLASLAVPSNAAATPTSPNVPALAKRQACPGAFFCPVANQNGAVLRVPVAVRANILVSGQAVNALICSYTNVLETNAIVNTRTCVYLGTNGVLTTNSNVQLEVNNAIACPSQAVCTAPEAAPSAVVVNPPAVNACVRNTCPRSTANPGTGAVLVAQVPVGVGATATIGNLANVNLLVCSYSAASALAPSDPLLLRTTVCIYQAQVGLATGALGLGTIGNLVANVGGSLGALLSLTGGVGGNFVCPNISTAPQTCTPIIALLRRGRRASADYLKRIIAARQFNPRSKRSASSRAVKKSKSS